MPYYAYIFKSTTDGSYYFGHTRDLEKQLTTFNAGKIVAAISSLPLVLHYHEIFETFNGAFQRVAFFKSLDGYIFLKLRGII